MVNERLWKYIYIGYLGILTIIGILVLIITLSFSISISGDEDLLPTVGFAFVYLFKFQIIGIVISGITTLISFARYLNYSKLSLIPLFFWILSFICNFIF